ncbi:LysR family transcriptional regulator [Novosphingobium sp. LASN5T]|uniref:LysR family transcriptional regulator n=1 Tax=Novosphingobium sp. LASN5T TaxID=2491021 RepID=UPI000F60267E|nr:LysR family transcriptional regulator [Novosphingobium sp. LASN5T]RQW46120.1 LysR family transcriptional regulator [Novosphingobium sp. LASN5T]
MPDRHPPPFAALRAFDVVGRHGGIRRAAEAMGVSHAIVSRHISTLEERLGVQLFNRQMGILTEAGLAFHGRISAAMAEIVAASDAVTGRSSRPLLIWSSAGFSAQWLARQLPKFGQGQNRRVIDLCASDHEPDFASGEADGDIRYQHDWSPPPSIEVRSEEIARPPMFPVAAPNFLNQCRFLGEITKLPLIQERSDREWQAWLKGQRQEMGDVPAPIARYGQAHLCLAAARAGQGVALANSILAAEDLADGRLVRLESSGEPFKDVPFGAYAFRSLRSRWQDPLLSRFRNWLRISLKREFSFGAL